MQPQAQPSKYYTYRDDFQEFLRRMQRFLPDDIPAPVRNLYSNQLTLRPVRYPEIAFGHELRVEARFSQAVTWEDFYARIQRRVNRRVNSNLSTFLLDELDHRDDPNWNPNYATPLRMFYYVFGCIFETDTLRPVNNFSRIFNIFDLRFDPQQIDVISQVPLQNTLGSYHDRNVTTDVWIMNFLQIPRPVAQRILNNICWGMNQNIPGPVPRRRDFSYGRLFTHRHINLDLFHVIIIFFHKILMKSQQEHPTRTFTNLFNQRQERPDFPVGPPGVAVDPYRTWMNIYLAFVQNLKYPLYKKIVNSWYHVTMVVGNVRRQVQIIQNTSTTMNIPREMGNIVYWRQNFNNANNLGAFFTENDNRHRNSLSDDNWYDPPFEYRAGSDGGLFGSNINLSILMGEYVFRLLQNIPRVRHLGTTFANLVFSYHLILGNHNIMNILGAHNINAAIESFYRTATIRIDMLQMELALREAIEEHGGRRRDREAFGFLVMNFLLQKISAYLMEILNNYNDMPCTFNQDVTIGNCIMRNQPRVQNIGDNLMNHVQNVTIIALNFVGIINQRNRAESLANLRAFHSTIEGWCDIYNPAVDKNCIMSCLKFIIQEDFRVIKKIPIPFFDDLSFTLFIHSFIGSKWVLMLTYLEKGEIYEVVKIFNQMIFEAKIVVYVYRSDQILLFDKINLEHPNTFVLLLYKCSVGIISKNNLNRLIYFRQHEKNWDPLPTYKQVIFNKEICEIKHKTYKIYGVNEKSTQMDYKIIKKQLMYVFDGKEVYENVNYKESKRINKKKIKIDKKKTFSNYSIYSFDIETVVVDYNPDNKEHFYTAWCICLVNDKDEKHYFWGQNAVKDFIGRLMEIYDLNMELEEENRKYILIYSFNGAKFDNIFILLYLLSAFGRNATILGKTTDLKCIYLGKWMQLLDLRLIFTRGSLNDLSKDILNESKIDFDIMKYVKDLKKFEENKEDIIKYCFQDCILVVKLAQQIYVFIKTLFIRCENTKFDSFKWFHPTLSLLSINLWRELTPPGSVILGCDNLELYQIEKSSYYGGMTLNIRKYFEISENNYLYHYDIYSSYPTVMKNCIIPIKFKKREILKHPLLCSSYKIVPYHLYRCKYRFKKICKIPAFPTRIDLGKKGLNGLVYLLSNEDQKEDSWIWGIEILQAQSELEFFEAYEEIQYYGDRIFAEYITLIYEMREKARKEKNDSFAYFLKLLMNSCYGKFGQQKYPNSTYLNGNELQEYMLNEDSIDINAKIKNLSIFEELPNGEVFFNLKLHPDSSMNWIGSCIKISSYIAAHARTNLYAGILEVGMENIYYFDTDSIFTTNPIKNKEMIKNELGCWKMEENNIIKACFLNPKVYMYKTNNNKEEYKCKGIPSKFLSAQFYEDLVNAKRVEIKNMKQIYHKLNKILFKEDTTKNIAILDVKRKYDENGDSLPFFNITEIKNNL